jgi:hypothetical protein
MVRRLRSAIMRRIDRFALHAIAAPMFVLVAVWGHNMVTDRAVMAVTQTQEAINASQVERDKSFDKRLEHLEKMQDAIFVALLGVFVAMVANIRSQKQRRHS